MILYPQLIDKATIGVTAPSSGVELIHHRLLYKAIDKLEADGCKIVCGPTAWTQQQAKSAEAAIRAKEFNAMMLDHDINLIIPPWGGELAIEILELLEYEAYRPKWILGYSDISIILLAITLRTGIATAHGTNLIDLRGKYTDQTTALWKQVLQTSSNSSVIQRSSAKYQKAWDLENESDHVFHLTEKTKWNTINARSVVVRGRLLGGCIDVIHHLVGTPFGEVETFWKKHIQDDEIIWYFENCELKTTDLRRALVQMKYAGWFDHCNGILFGRTEVNDDVEGYTTLHIYEELYEELQVPIIYDIDCGHVPPQITLINGAYAVVEVAEGKGEITQHFI